MSPGLNTCASPMGSEHLVQAQAEIKTRHGQVHFCGCLARPCSELQGHEMAVKARTAPGAAPSDGLGHRTPQLSSTHHS